MRVTRELVRCGHVRRAFRNALPDVREQALSVALDCRIDPRDYLLMSTAVNVPRSALPALPDTNADALLLYPASCAATRYV